MHDPTEHQRSTGVAPSAARGTFTAFGARHVKGVSVARWVAAVCFVVWGAVLLAFGQWWGVFLFAPAGLNGSLAYLVPRWNLLRDAPKNVERVRELQRSRAVVVDDAAARLRRIGQDLHDGAQAQMVAVVMKLGLARDHLSTAAARLGDADSIARALSTVAWILPWLRMIEVSCTSRSTSCPVIAATSATSRWMPTPSPRSAARLVPASEKSTRMACW